MQDIIDGMDPAKAALAFEETQPLLLALTALRRLNTDINKAALAAAAVGRMVKLPDVRAEFAALPATRFDIQHVDRLESVALATWYASMRLRNAVATATGAKIPEEVMAEAVTLKTTMLRVLAYHLGDVKDVSEILADIIEGTGYMDTATDLARLGDLYEAHAATLAVDTMRYRPEDRDRAGRLAGAIHQVLGDGRHSEAQHWSDMQARAWTFLILTYDEVAVTGRWLYRHEDGETRFPSLYGVGRQRRRRPGQPDELPDELPGDEPGEPDDIGEPAAP